MRPTLIAPLIAAFLAAGCAPAQLPAPAPAEPLAERTVGIGSTARIGSVAVTPLAVVEDSRCPQDVTCIWAGRVLIRARIEAGAGSSTAEMELGKPVAAANELIVLAEVRPDRISGAGIAPADYRFVFAPAR